MTREAVIPSPVHSNLHNAPFSARLETHWEVNAKEVKKNVCSAEYVGGDESRQSLVKVFGSLIKRLFG